MSDEQKLSQAFKAPRGLYQALCLLVDVLFLVFVSRHQ